MEIVRGLDNWMRQEPVGSVALGYFDGVHRGHQAIIAASVNEAQKRGLPSVVLTFEPHPLTVVRPETAPPLITPFSEKARLVQQLGVDVLLVVHFTPAFADLSAFAFAKTALAETLKAQHVTVGYSYSFGRGGQGTPEALTEWGKGLGFEVTVIPPVQVEGETVSSSLIRGLLAQGELEKATALLGRPPAVSGRVVHGARRGRRLGFPTANVELKPRLALPRFGVYAVRSWYAHRVLPGVANLGQVPTFEAGPARLEVHFMGFHENLYGKRLRVEFIAFLRAERRFESAAELKAQMELDAKRAEEMLARTQPSESDRVLFTTTGVCDRI